MISNQIKLAWRNLNKNRAFSIINIIGLSIGVASCLLILQFVAFELSYNAFHEKSKNIYRVSYSKEKNGVESFNTVLIYSGVGPGLKETFPEVIDFVRLRPASIITAQSVITSGEDVYEEQRVYFSEPALFRIFSFEMVKGNPESSLREQFTAVISERTAKKYYGDQDPIGKTFKRGISEEYTVTGVFKDVPVNSHIKFDFLLSHSSLEAIMLPEWTEHNVTIFHGHLFILLEEGVDPLTFQEKLPKFATDFIWAKQGSPEDTKVILNAMPIRDIHLHSNIQHEAEVNGNYNTVKYLMIIVGLLLFIAWVNVVNLSTAKSTERAKEVGIRKVLGSSRNQLMAQFFLESMLINAIAIVLAIGMVFLSQGIFHRFGITELVQVKPWGSPAFWLSLIPLFLLGILFSGTYPALVLSRFHPSLILKGRYISSSAGTMLRKGLVVFQFVASICLLIGTHTVYQQVQFMRNHDLGINIQKSLVVKAPSNVDSTYTGLVSSFKNTLSQNLLISNVIATADIPGREYNSATWFRRINESDDKAQFFYRSSADEDFIPSMDVTLLAGRNFEDIDNEFASIINEKALYALNFADPQQAIGEELTYMGSDGSLRLKVIGVIKDYHHLSPRLENEPVLFTFSRQARKYFIIKMKPESASGESTQTTIASCEAAFKEIFPGNPFNYFFLEEEFEKQYQADRNFGRLFGIFSLLAVFIACMGLFGLSSYMVVQKTKEIGIRKILGSSVGNILKSLSIEYIKLILIANLIAWPLIYYLMNKWLETFVSHIQMNLWQFVIAGISITVISLLTISIHTSKAALANPVDALRSE
jgi:putative ABC transport system permease protein